MQRQSAAQPTNEGSAQGTIGTSSGMPGPRRGGGILFPREEKIRKRGSHDVEQKGQSLYPLTEQTAQRLGEQITLLCVLLQDQQAHPYKFLYTVEEAWNTLSIGKTKFYELVGEGKIHILKEGRRSLVHHRELERYTDTLLEESRRWQEDTAREALGNIKMVAGARA